MKLEAKIGLFVILGLAALFLLSTQVTKFATFNEKGYEIGAYLDDATGLELQTKVSMNGVGIGEVSKIYIEGRRVRLKLLIQDQVEIPVDSLIIVSQESVLGAKAINILAGSSDENIAVGGVLEHSKQYAAFDETSDSVNAAATELQELLKDFRNVLDTKRQEEIKEMIDAFRNVGVNIDKIVLENRQALKEAIAGMRDMGNGFAVTARTVNKDLPKIMARIDSLTRRLDSIALTLDKKLPVAMNKFIAIEDNVSGLIDDNRDSLKSTLTSADDFFRSGQDAFDKVDSMLSNFTVSELQINVKTDYMVNDSYVKTTAGIIYLPNPETYYMLDVISMNDYSEVGVEPGLHDESETYISAQYGKRFDNLLLRAGLVESTGGFGVDYYANNDRFTFSADAYDFNAVNDVRGDNAHIRVGVRYKMLKHLELFGGWDNIANPESQTLYFGVGMRFIDNNLKYVLGSASSIR
jgi:phospholipid/cholesterol/gamma-HCH transport system substrate-binding protein